MIVNFSQIRCLQCSFRSFGSTSNRPHNRRPPVWRCVGERFADVKVVNRVPHRGGGVMVWEDISSPDPSCLSLQYLCCSSLCVGGLGSVCYIWSTSPVLFGVLCESKCAFSNSFLLS
ncbi:unnamed protein product, partial [Oncorhynchus mykiss]